MSACLEGTREDVIGEIARCIKRGDCPICWLSGPAGSGKSAVSQTIAQHYDDKGRLLASFFFLRGAGDRSIITRLIPTLAYQLSISMPATARLIRDVLQKEPGIFSQSHTHQFKRLVVEPIMAARNTIVARLPWTKPAVIVMDALDECDDKDLMAEFIGAVLGAFQANRRLPFRVLFTSRVEEHIRQTLEPLQPVWRCIVCLSKVLMLVVTSIHSFKIDSLPSINRIRGSCTMYPCLGLPNKKLILS